MSIICFSHIQLYLPLQPGRVIHTNPCTQSTSAFRTRIKPESRLLPPTRAGNRRQVPPPRFRRRRQRALARGVTWIMASRSAARGSSFRAWRWRRIKSEEFVASERAAPKRARGSSRSSQASDRSWGEIKWEMNYCVQGKFSPGFFYAYFSLLRLSGDGWIRAWVGGGRLAGDTGCRVKNKKGKRMPPGSE